MILESLQKKGLRMTKARIALAKVLDCDCLPKTVVELIDEISANHDVYPDRTTIYRELEQLKALGLVDEHTFEDGVTRFRQSQHRHVHHVICTECREVQEVELLESEIHQTEEELATKLGFSGLRHTLEFYGTCKKCK